MHARLALLVLLAFALNASSSPALPQEGLLVGRTGLAKAEEKPATVATWETTQAALAGFQAQATRVDLWVSGTLTLVRTDGALWYLAVCSSPGPRAMCVTYSDNGMKVGESVTLRGDYRPQDERHVLLDPCLASRS